MLVGFVHSALFITARVLGNERNLTFDPLFTSTHFVVRQKFINVWIMMPVFFLSCQFY